MIHDVFVKVRLLSPGCGSSEVSYCATHSARGASSCFSVVICYADAGIKTGFLLGTAWILYKSSLAHISDCDNSSLAQPPFLGSTMRPATTGERSQEMCVYGLSSQ